MSKQIAELGAIHEKQIASVDGTLTADPRKQAWIDKWEYS